MIKKYFLICIILVSSYIKTSQSFYIPTVYPITFHVQPNSQNEIDITHEITGPPQLCYESTSNTYLYLRPITLLIITKQQATDVNPLSNPLQQIPKSLSSYDRSPYHNDIKVSPNPHKKFSSENLSLPRIVQPQNTTRYLTDQSHHQQKLLPIPPQPIIGPPNQ